MSEKQDNKVSSSPGGMPAGAPAKRRKRLWLRILVACVVALLILFALLPSLLSLGFARRIALAQANSRLNGKLDIESWSLGWFSGFNLHGINVTDARGESVIRVKDVTMPASVPSLLGSTKSVGNVEIVSPYADIIVNPDGTNNLMALMKTAEGGAPSTGPSGAQAGAPAGKPQRLGLDIQGSLTIKDGEILLRRGADMKPISVRDLNMNVKIDSLSKPISLEMKAALGDERAPLEVKGSATVLKDGVLDPEAVQADAKVTLSGFDLAPLGGMAQQYGAPLDIAGKLDMDLTAQVQGKSSVKTSGAVVMNAVSLSGGPLGGDQPKFDKVSLNFDVTLAGRSVKISEFKFDSPVANATASGTLELPAAGKLPTGNLTSQARVDLAAVAARFPHTMKLQKGLTIDSGTLALDTKVVSDEHDATVESSIRLDNLAATREGKHIALEAPLALAIKASQTDKGPMLDSLDLTSSFANGHGSGNLEKFDLTLTSDLAVAAKEAAKFVDLGGRSAAGQAALDLHVAPAEAQQRKVSMALKLTGLELSGIGPKPFALKEATLALDALALLNENNSLQQVSGLTVNLASPIASAGFTAASITPAPGENPPVELKDGKLTANADLADLMTAARNFANVPADTGLKGRMSLNAGVSVAKNAVQLDPVDLTIQDLDVSQGEKHLRQPEVRLTGAVSAQPSSRAATVRTLVCALSFGKLEVPQADVSDWAKAPEGVNAEVRGDFNVESALTALKDFAKLPEGTTAGGQITFDTRITYNNAQTNVNLQAQVNALKVTSKSMPPFEEERITLDAAASRASRTGDVDLSSVKVASSLLNLDAKATLRDMTITKKVQADGTLDCNFDRIGPLAAAFSGQPIEMSGRQARPFSFTTSLAGKDWRELVRATLASAGIYIARLKVMGIETGPMDIPLKAADGKASVRIATTVNGGTLSLPAEVDAMGPVAVLEVPDNTPMLAQVTLTDAMADQLMARAIPLFKGCVGATGKVGFTSRKLRAPLEADAAKKATMDGELALDGVGFRPAGFMEKILNLIGLGAAQLALPDQRVSVALKDGRFTQGPLEIRVGAYALRISGSVGLTDKTLDMVAEVPVTREMLGGQADAYDLLKSEVLRIPIKGTTSKPEVSGDIFKENRDSLLKGAARKLLERKGGDLLRKGMEGIFKRK